MRMRQPTASTIVFRSIAPADIRYCNGPRAMRRQNPCIGNEAGMSFSFSKIRLAVHGAIPVCGTGTVGLGLGTREDGNSKMEAGGKPLAMKEIVGQNSKMTNKAGMSHGINKIDCEAPSIPVCDWKLENGKWEMEARRSKRENRNWGMQN
jgi:hypothetical protein